jgi:hypothetical protein
VFLEGVYGYLSHFAVLDISQAFDQDIEVYSVRGIEVKLVPESRCRLLWCQRLVERILHAVVLS